MQREEGIVPGSEESGASTSHLTPGELRTWITFWATTHLVDIAIDRDLRARSGLSHTDYQLLVMLSNAPGQRLRMSELAEIIFASRSKLTYQITQLERTGIVRREDDPIDKRGAFAVLTPQGLELLRAAGPGHIATVRRIFFDRLTSDQVAALGDALQSVFAGFGKNGSLYLQHLIEQEVSRGER